MWLVYMHQIKEVSRVNSIKKAQLHVWQDSNYKDSHMLKVNGIGTNNLAHTNQKYSEVTALMSKNRENHQKRHFTMIKEDIKSSTCMDFISYNKRRNKNP